MDPARSRRVGATKSHGAARGLSGLSARCRPVAVDGPVAEAERRRLDAVFAGALSEQCAWDAASAWAA
ncbi:hypothetical protein LNAOJCKE_5565 [Methylorubrum aminovorans]|uniref:Uncharacterized protein n=1 Tax=Methylorubrum aminovorans TaxID=269069 RepID=A0ABQ4UMF7_9HYPH|nr:hypothetical protein LNAOJCKE_5565 [Methylorubrum aminovorans]